MNVSFCAGWIDSDVYHDLKIIKKIRNEFAHSIEDQTLNDGPFASLVGQLKVPKREYYDWGELRAVATKFAVVLFTGDRPSNAKEDIAINNLIFRHSISVLVAVLVANLKIPIYDGDSLTTLQLPDHMRDIPE